jgi:subtilisin family serine protease
VTPRSWNTDRIDNLLSPHLDNSYSYCTTGRGVRAYVVDTGIWAGHDEFSNPDPVTGQTRVPLGFDVYTHIYGYTNRSTDPCDRTRTDDSYLYGGSHGTAVASVLGGRTMGAAPEVTLVPVRVFDCTSRGGLNAVYGLNWIANEVVPEGTQRVVNMSWTITLSNPADLTKHPVETAIDGLLARGITVVAAAGNDNMSTANFTPARYSPILVVGGSKGQYSTDPDSRWNDGPIENPGSNYGASIDVFAPADRVVAAQWTGPFDTRPLGNNRWSSGTSFAAPLVAGAVARNLQLQPENHAQSEARIIGEATTEVHGLNLLDRQGSPNRLLFMYTDCVKRRPSGS